MSKFRELPAFETNEFKVGDRIKCYDSVVPENHSGYFVKDKEGSFVSFECRIGSTHCFRAHFKQCRKLEEVKPREFYLRTIPVYHPITKEYIYEYYSINDCNKPEEFSEEYIKVREVMEEE